MEPVTRVLERDPRIAYALVFGSTARGSAHAGSDLDVAIGTRPGASFSSRELGTLVTDLEQAAGRSVDLLMLDQAPPAVSYRVFRDGVAILVRDRALLTARRARAILDYLDFRPLEERLIQGALGHATRG